MKKAPVQGFAYVRKHAGFKEFTLIKNGLRVLISEAHEAPVVGLMVTYHVGSRNEVTGTTGATHMLEHLLFEDTKKFRKKNGNDLTRILDEHGAHLNATTWFDRTHYFEVFNRDIFEQALAIEADRMRNSLFSEQDRQMEMTIVRNEFERGENDPTEALDKALWNTAFFSHPYRHSTIGYRSDIENMKATDLHAFYDVFYHPNNATVTIIGDVTLKDALQKTMKTFGSIPASKHRIPEVYTVEVPQEGERRVVVERRSGSPIFGLVQKIPEGLHEDIPALLVLSTVFGDGKGSRLGKALLSSGKASSVAVQPMLLKDPGLMCLYVHLTPAATHQEIERIVVREMESLQTNGVSAPELSSAKAKVTASDAFGKDGYMELLFKVNESLAAGDWRFYFDLPARVAAVKASEVKRAAEKYFKPATRTVGYYKKI